MRRIKSLFMLLAMMAGGFLAYGQTSPQDTYYKFNQTYAAGATVAPYEGNGGNLTVKQAVISLPDNSYPKHYLDQKYYFGMPIAQQSTQAQRITIDASPENPAHIFIVGNCTTTSPSILKLAFNTYDNVIDQWQPLSHNITTRESPCVVELTTTHSGEHLLYMSNTAGNFYLSEIRVLYEQNEMWTNIRNSLSLELNQTTTTTANPEAAYFFRLQGCFWSTEAGGYYISHDNSNSRLVRNISFKPYADGTIAMKAIKRTDGDHDYFYISVLTRPSTCEKSESSYRRYEAPTTVTDFSFPVQKGVEYVIDGTIAVPEIRFIPDHYTVTLDANGGTVDPTELVYIKGGDPILAFPEASKEGLDFDNWYSEGEGDEPSFPLTPTADITYIADWDMTFTLMSDGNIVHQESGIPTDETRTPDSQSCPANGLMFDYWTADQDVQIGGALVIAGTPIPDQTNVLMLRNTIFTAHWTNPHGQCGDNLSWEYDPSTTTLTISGSGEMYNYSSTTQPWKNYRNGITTIVIEDGATTIGNSAFTNCSNLASVTIPGSVTLINPAAFMNCTALTSITIPSNVETIQNSAFYGCSSLEDVTIERATAPSVAPTTFMNIASSTTLHVPYGASGYTGSNWNMFTIVEMNPSGQCGDDLYWLYDPSTTTLTITGTGDMYDYTNSTHAPWYDYRTAITTVVLPDGLTKIGNYAFYQCNNASLTSINIPASVTSIGQNAFNNCTKLASVTIPSSVTSIGLGAFFKCTSLTSINIPSGVTSIEGLTFAQCGLTTINIPANVTTIGEDAFQSCHSLAAITLAEGLESIGAGAFMYCYPLTSIDIPASVTSIGTWVFSDCSSLADVTVHWETNIPTFGDYAFYNVPVANVKLHVPCEKKSDYAAETGWKDFTIVDPCEGIYPITANGDPDNAGIYYSTFYYGSAKYAVPENVEAYAASVNGSDLVLTKIAEANEVLPAGTAVILKSTVDSYTMVPSDGTAVTITATNHLHGVDVDTEISSVVTSGSSCYVLSYKSGYGVGFYLYQSPNQLKAHKAYINLDGSGAAQAPRHLRFVFNSTTGIEDVQGEDVQGEKFLRDGVLYIQRGEHLYNAQGMKVQ